MLREQTVIWQCTVHRRLGEELKRDVVMVVPKWLAGYVFVIIFDMNYNEKIYIIYLNQM